jgi:ferrochelatase
MRRGYLLVNFGGPRDLEEVEPFLKELLCDRDVVRSGLPELGHRLLFSMIAKLRAKRIREEYTHIGGKSPIYEDTQWLADRLRGLVKGPLWTFHRYLPKTHEAFLEQMKLMQQMDEIIVLPLFPQVSYATTGSIARFFQEKMPAELWQKLRWIPSYASEPGFIEAYRNRIEEALTRLCWQPQEVAILASFHGVPQSFVKGGDPYTYECEKSFQALKVFFPHAVWKKSFQSKFGPGEWARPYTQDVCSQPDWVMERKKVLVVPLAFTSDHIETLSEIERQYLPLLREKKLMAERVEAINRCETFAQAMIALIQKYEKEGLGICNQFLIASYCFFPRLCFKWGRCACVKK